MVPGKSGFVTDGVYVYLKNKNPELQIPGFVINIVSNNIIDAFQTLSIPRNPLAA